jgi:2-dehydropantoate 2-reductase
LARAGHEVALVARGAALDAIRARGVRVESTLGTFDARVETAASPRELAPVDAVLVAVKTWQVRDVVATLAPMVASGGIVVPLENGVDAPDECVAALGAERVVGGLCHMLSFIAEPGAVKHAGGPPSYTFGAWRAPLDGRVEALVDALKGAGGRPRVVDDFPAALWEKFLFIASFGGVGAIARATAGAMRAEPATRRLLEAAFEEVRAIAAAKKIALASDVVQKTMAYVDTLPADAIASLQRDVVAARPSEIDALSGAVARIGAELGVDTPVHRTIYAALVPADHAARASNPSLAKRGT